MPARFTVLASGSAGNAALLQVNGVGLLLDCGLGPRVLGHRLAVFGLNWNAIHAVLLTHTHGDHWNHYTLGQLARLRIPLFAHDKHHAELEPHENHRALETAKLIRTYSRDWFEPLNGLRCLPVPVPHDADPTFGFRIEPTGEFGWALGYAADVGHPTAELVGAFNGIDLLAIEFNHDVAMQRSSNRSALLIERVLGKYGHLSNEQGAEVVRKVGRSGSLRQVVQLHLSRDCNTPLLARQAGVAALPKSAALHLASQFEPLAPIEIADRPRESIEPPTRTSESVQQFLPGMGATETGKLRKLSGF